MMNNQNEVVNVRILDREYTVGVEAQQRDGLLAAARLLDRRMRDIRGANKLVAIDRIAVLAALNLAHELQQTADQNQRRERELSQTLDALQRRLDQLAEP